VTSISLVAGVDLGRHADLIEAVRRSCRLVDLADPIDEATTLRLKNHVPDADDRLWVSESAGFALLTHSELHLAVTPAQRGHGIGSGLVKRALALSDAEGRETWAWAHGNHPGAERLAKAHDFVPVREVSVLRRAAHPPLPDLVIPDGYRLRGYESEDAQALLRVNASAFAGHPEQGAMDAANLAERMAEPWFDPAGLLLLIDPAGQVAGFHWTKIDPGAARSPSGPAHGEAAMGEAAMGEAAMGEVSIGEVYVIAVDPRAHGRGLGRTLLSAGLHHLVDSGVDEVMLYVEADNAAAVALYSSLGFTHRASDTHVRYHRPCHPAPGQATAEPEVR
jgi:mycothiol synthase